MITKLTETIRLLREIIKRDDRIIAATLEEQVELVIERCRLLLVWRLPKRRSEFRP